MNIICLPCTIVVGKFKEHALAMEKKKKKKEFSIHQCIQGLACKLKNC